MRNRVLQVVFIASAFATASLPGIAQAETKPPAKTAAKKTDKKTMPSMFYEEWSYTTLTSKDPKKEEPNVSSVSGMLKFERDGTYEHQLWIGNFSTFYKGTFHFKDDKLILVDEEKTPQWEFEHALDTEKKKLVLIDRDEDGGFMMFGLELAEKKKEE